MATTKKKAAKKAIKPAAKKTAPKKVAVKQAVAKKAAPKKAVVKKAAPKKAAAKVAAPVAPRVTTVNSYISFNGNCEQAFNYYKSVFGGAFTSVSRYTDMPTQPGMPAISKAEGKKIMHVSLPISNETVMMGCDILTSMGHTYTPGNNFSMSITAPSKQEADRLFKALSKGGKVSMPMTTMFWGAYFGMCADKFGTHWMISFE
jgi:PhnB protein